MSLLYRNPAGINILVLILGDLLLGAGAIYAGFHLRFGGLNEGILEYEPLSVRIAAFVVVIVFCSFFTELYNQDKNPGKKETLLRVASVIGFSFFILSALYYIMPFVEIGRGILIISLIIFGILQSSWHLTYEFCLHLPGFAKKVLILGTGQSAEKIGKLINSTNHNYVLSGYINCFIEPAAVPSFHSVGNGNSIMDVARKERAQKIVISLSERRGTLPLKDILNCKLSGIDVLDAPSFYEELTGKLLIENITPSWFIFSDGFRITPLKKSSKRISDVIFAFIGLIFALPLIPITALLIKIDSRGPVFFRQVRMGEMERKFVLYKFRTMRQDAENGTGAVWTQENDPRITRLGRFLRKSRLDEIPQLFNVLKGDMSFIGPRPERPEFVEKLKEIIPYYSERHFVKPGITGWAQIKYPYGASVEDAIEKLRYDLYYIKHLSIMLDLLIVLETVKVVLFGRGGR
jgi:sugar transferase (PEP-CTERM system associated)